MADKTLKIKLEVDVSEAGKIATIVEETARKLTKLEELDKARAALMRQEQAAYKELSTTVATLNKIISENSSLAVKGKQEAIRATEEYNAKVRITQEELRKLNTLENANIALIAGRGASSTNKGYIPNSQGTVADNRALQEAERLQKYLADLEFKRVYTFKSARDQEVAYTRGSVAEQQALYDKLFKSYTQILTNGMSRGAKFNASSFTEGMSSSGQLAATKANTEAYKQQAVVVEEAAKVHKNLLLHIIEIAGIYKILNLTIHTTWAALKAIPNVGIELDSTKASLIATTGSAANMNSVLIALHDEAIRTGIPIDALRESFRGFQASTSLAGASIQSTWKMFTNLDTVITGLHLSTDKANGIFLAMAQIFNKGKVQSEELVKQLGNLLPGAFASMAASMGISGQELSKRMKAGAVLAKDVMEDFTSYYANRFAPAFNIAAQGLNANIGRLKTSATELGETLYSKTSEAMNSVVKVLTETINSINEAITGTTNLTNAFNTGLNIALAAGVGYLASITLGMWEVKGAAITTTLSMDALTAATAAWEASLSFITKPALLIAGFALVGLEMAKFSKEAHSAALAVEKTLADAAKTQAEPQKPGSLEFKVANDPEVKRISAEKAQLEADLVITQNKLKGVNFELGDNLAQLRRDEARYTKDLESLVPVLDNVREKAKIKIQIETGTALADISAVAREMEIAFKQASGDSVGAAKMVFEDQHKKSLTELQTIINEGNAVPKGLPVNNLTAQKNILNINASEEDKAKAQQYIDNYYLATKAIDQYNIALSKAGSASINKTASTARKAEYSDIDYQRKLAQQQNDVLSAQQDNFYKHNLISIEYYYKGKRQLVEDDNKFALDAAQKAFDIASKGGNQQEILKTTYEVQRIKNDIAKQQEAINLKEADDQTNLQKKYKETEIVLLELQGRFAEAAKLKLEVNPDIKLFADQHTAAGDTHAAMLQQIADTQAVAADIKILHERRILGDRKYQDDLQRINVLVNAGGISQVQSWLEIDKATKLQIGNLKTFLSLEDDRIDKAQQAGANTEALNNIRKESQGARDELLKLEAEGSVTINHIGNMLSDSMVTPFSDFIQGTITAKQAFTNFSVSIQKELANMAAEALKTSIITPLIKQGLGMALSAFAGSADTSVAAGNSEAFTSTMNSSNFWTTKNANGNIFSNGNIVPFAKGGIPDVGDQLQYFPMANGGVGSLRENGPEAIIPLARDSSGKLGVKSLNGGGNSGGIVIQNMVISVHEKEGTTSEEQAKQIGEAVRSQLKTLVQEQIVTSQRSGGTLNPTTMAASF